MLLADYLKVLFRVAGARQRYVRKHVSILFAIENISHFLAYFGREVSA